MQHQDKERGDTGQDRPFQQRNAQQQFEANRCTNKLGQICGHGNDFRLNPIGPNRRARETIANVLCQIFTGGNTEFCGQQLDQHRHDVGPHHHPQQGVAKGSACLDVGSKITGIDIADSRYECGAHQGKFDLPGRATGGFNHITVQHVLNPYFY
ncbi:hypothetical protein D3C71_1488260 [compost metagenome]